MPIIDELPYSSHSYTFTELIKEARHYGRELYRAVAPDGRDVVVALCDMLSDRYDAADEPEEIPEYKYLSQCSAPSLPRVTGCGMLSDDDDDFRLAYIEFEPFGDGFVSLEDHVAANGPMSEADVVSVTNDIISAIADIVLATDGGGHYNIHPGNVWVRFSEEGAKPEVRLTGTGYIGPSCNGITPFQRKWLRPSYRCPESYRGRLGYNSEQFPIALVAGFMLMGRHPWGFSDEETTDTDEAMNKFKTLRPSLRKFRSLSPAWQNLLTRATAINRDKRFRLFVDMSGMLDRIINRQDGEDDEEYYKSVQNTYLPPRPQQVTAKGAVKEEAGVAAAMTRGGGTLDDVAGMEALKTTLRRNFIDILRHRELAAKYDITPPNAILLYGAPGCGKTFIAEKAAQESGLNYKIVNPGDLGSIYIHGAQEKIANLFEQARKNAPTILILDEFDAIAPARSSGSGEAHHQAGEVNELLTRLNNCASAGVYVIAMTNRPDMVDKAMLRKGRIDEMFYVPMPDKAARSGIFRLELRNRPVADDVDPDALADMTENLTCSDITYIVKEAARDCFDRTIRTGADSPLPLTAAALGDMIARTTPSVTTADIRHYNRLAERFASSTDRESLPPAGFIISR